MIRKVALALSLLAIGAGVTPLWASPCVDLTTCEGGGTVVSSITPASSTSINTTPGTSLPGPSGFVSSWAVLNDSLNPFGSNDLTFIYQVNLLGDSISSITFNGFNSVPASATWSNTAGDLAPNQANFNIHGGVNFEFLNDTAAPVTSDYLIVFTDSQSVSTNLATLNDSGDSSAPSLAPVPEPASMTLFGSGMVGLAGLIRRWRKA